MYKKQFLIIGIIFLPVCGFADQVLSTKQVFIKKILSLSTRYNAIILRDRGQIKALENQYQHGNNLSSAELFYLRKLARQYRVYHWNIKQHSDWQQLLSRVDVVPSSLVLAQAAIESAWGTSRFARQGNSLFGQWCYQKGCGIVPLHRPVGASYEVKSFPSAYAAIGAYIDNLNTNKSYQSFRNKRAQLRASKKPLTGYELAAGLSRYSQRGQAYVTSVRGLISRYQLERHN